MNLDQRIPKTPARWTSHRKHPTHTISTLSRPNTAHLQLPQSSIERHSRGRPARFRDSKHCNSSQQPTKAPPNASFTTAFLNYTPSLKAQKKQYLKLFTTASTHKEEPEDSNQSVQGSPLRKLDEESSFHNEGVSAMEDSRISVNTPTRQLFCQFVIEKEQKIVIDPVDNQEKRGTNTEVQQPSTLQGEGTSSFSEAQLSTHQINVQGQSFNICLGCFAFIPSNSCKTHELNCDRLRLSGEERVQALVAKGMQLIGRIEAQSGSLLGLGEHCSAFLKECELAWSAGRPSEIYNFKLRELQANSTKLTSCMRDICCLNFLLALRQTH